MSEDRKYKIYVHTNKLNGKKYIGITFRKLSARFQNGRGYAGCRYFNRAIKKYGWESFAHELIADDLSVDEANALEKYYIAKFHARDKRYGYNIQNGGLSGGGMSDEGRASSSLAHSGGNAANARCVVVFNRAGVRLGEFPTIKDAATAVGESRSVARRSALLKRMTSSGNLFFFKPECEYQVSIPETDLKNYIFPHNPGGDLAQHRTEVFAYGSDGSFLREFASVSSAASFFGVSSCCVIRSARDFHQSKVGIFFRYKSDFFGVSFLSKQDLLENGYRAGLCRPVRIYDSRNGQFVKEFQSLKDAESYVGVSIWDSLSGLQKTAGNYVCRYSENYSDIETLPEEELPPKNPLPNRRTAVSQFGTDGNFIKDFVSAAQAQRETGVSASAISNCIRGKSKTAGGFIWKYND